MYVREVLICRGIFVSISSPLFMDPSICLPHLHYLELIRNLSLSLLIYLDLPTWFWEDSLVFRLLLYELSDEICTCFAGVKTVVSKGDGGGLTE